MTNDKTKKISNSQENFHASFDDVRKQNLQSFAASTPDEKVKWLGEMLQFIQDLRKNDSIKS